MFQLLRNGVHDIIYLSLIRRQLFFIIFFRSLSQIDGK